MAADGRLIIMDGSAEEDEKKGAGADDIDELLDALGGPGKVRQS